jgi:hypothetical protein
MKFNDRMIGICTILLSLYLGSTLWNTHLQTKGFPFICLLLLIVLSVILICRNERTLEIKNGQGILVNLLLVGLYVIGLNFIGFVIPSIVYLALFTIINRYKGKKKYSIAFCLLYPICLYIIFEYVFGVTLASGSLI